LKTAAFHLNFEPSKNYNFMMMTTENNINYQRIEQAIRYLEEKFSAPT